MYVCSTLGIILYILHSQIYVYHNRALGPCISAQGRLNNCCEKRSPEGKAVKWGSDYVIRNLPDHKGKVAAFGMLTVYVYVHVGECTCVYVYIRVSQCVLCTLLNCNNSVRDID